MKKGKERIKYNKGKVQGYRYEKQQRTGTEKVKTVIKAYSCKIQMKTKIIKIQACKLTKYNIIN